MSKVMRIKSPHFIMLLFVTIIFLMPMSALAIEYQYTYTSPTFTDVTGPIWTTSDRLIVSFTFDPGSAAGSQSGGIPFTMSAGSYSTNSTGGTHYIGPSISITWNAAGGITDWAILDEENESNLVIFFDCLPTLSMASMQTLDNPVYATALVDGKGYWGQVATGGGGDTDVPEPATMLLLGLGLMGIAGVRRKIKK